MAKSNLSERMQSRFKKAAEIKGQHDLIADLKEQIEVLKKTQTKTDSEAEKHFLVDITALQPSNQSRQTFTQKMIAERMQSLKTQGQLSPLVIFPLQQGKKAYAIEDGELTWRAATALVEQGETNWKQLAASLSNANSESELHFRSLLHHLHKENLNALDRVDSVMVEIEDKCGIEPDTAFKALNNIAYKIKKNPQIGEAIERSTSTDDLKQNTTISNFLSAEQISILYLLFLLQIDFKSFIKTDLSFYPISEDLKATVRVRELPCSHALLLNKLKLKHLPNKTEAEIRSIRNEAIDKVLSENLSHSQTKELVKNILVKHSNKKVVSTSSKQLKKVQKQIDSLSLQDFSQDELTSFKDSLEVRLAEIKQILS